MLNDAKLQSDRDRARNARLLRLEAIGNGFLIHRPMQPAEFAGTVDQLADKVREWAKAQQVAANGCR